MPNPKTDREKEILHAALAEFAQKGFEGARLQTIADNIGVTKAMIHYYYETKENLFREVFREACDTVMGSLLNILETEEPLFKKIEQFVGAAIERFHTEPALVNFITSALNRNPESTVRLMQELMAYDASIFEKQLREAASNYEIASIESRHVVVNMLSLCMFPYTARTFVSELLSMENEETYQDFLKSRKGIVIDTIINWLAS